MKYRIINPIQIGDIQAFKKMLADAINNPGLLIQGDENRHAKKCQSTFPYNDKHYPSGTKAKVDSADS